PTERVAPPAAAAPTGTDPSQAGNITWGLLMDMKKANGGALSPTEQARYDALMAAANGGSPAAPGGAAAGPAAPSAPPATGTDPSQAGNITWGLLMDMKKANGGTLTASEQARYNALMAAANQGAPAAPGGAPAPAPSAPAPSAPGGGVQPLPGV